MHLNKQELNFDIPLLRLDSVEIETVINEDRKGALALLKETHSSNGLFKLP